jgi:ABC-2 type transport system permease protein
MNAFANHFSFEFRVGIRNKTLMLMNYLFPLGCYLLFGALMGAVNPGFLLTIVPAMSLFTIMGGALLGMPSSLVSAREAGIFRTYKINGVPALSILIIPVLTSMLHALLATVIIALTAPALFDGRAPTNWLGFLLVFLAAAFAFAGIGTLIGVVSSDSRITVLYSQLVFLPSMILGGLMLPSSILPSTMAKLGLLLPTTYAMEAFNGLAMGQADAGQPWLSFAILVAGGLLAVAMSVFLFSWDSKNATRRGHPALALLAWLPYVVGMLLSLRG